MRTTVLAGLAAIGLCVLAQTPPPVVRPSGVKPPTKVVAKLPLIQSVEDLTRPKIHVATSRGEVPLALYEGRAWKIVTSNIPGNATGRTLVLTRAGASPVNVRIQQWNGAEIIALLPSGALGTGGGEYKLELREGDRLIASRGVTVWSRVPDDVDHDGAGRADDCDDFDARRVPGNAEVCDVAGLDEDCDPSTVGTRDNDGDGYLHSTCTNKGAPPPSRPYDCDDYRAEVYPGRPESCDGLDNDCNGRTDEGVGYPAYVDADRDGYGTGAIQVICDATKIGQGFALVPGDCDDRNAAVKPGAGCS